MGVGNYGLECCLRDYLEEGCWLYEEVGRRLQDGIAMEGGGFDVQHLCVSTGGECR